MAFSLLLLESSKPKACTTLESGFKSAIIWGGNVKLIYMLFMLHFIFGYKDISKMVYVLRNAFHAIMTGFAL